MHRPWFQTVIRSVACLLIGMFLCQYLPLPTVLGTDGPVCYAWHCNCKGFCACSHSHGQKSDRDADEVTICADVDFGDDVAFAPLQIDRTPTAGPAGLAPVTRAVSSLELLLAQWGPQILLVDVFDPPRRS